MVRRRVRRWRDGGRVKILRDAGKGGSERVKSQSGEEEGGKERLERLNCLSVLFFWNKKIREDGSQKGLRLTSFSPGVCRGTGV